MKDGVILIADDDENDVFLFKRALASLKISNPVHVVTNGEAVINYLGGHGEYQDRVQYPFPILLALNLQMPRRNGAEVLAWMQTHPELPPVKVLIVSGFDEPGRARQAYHFGGEHFLRKPPKPEQLEMILRQIEGLSVSTSVDGFRLDRDHKH